MNSGETLIPSIITHDPVMDTIIWSGTPAWSRLILTVCDGNWGDFPLTDEIVGNPLTIIDIIWSGTSSWSRLILTVCDGNWGDFPLTDRIVGNPPTEEDLLVSSCHCFCCIQNNSTFSFIRPQFRLCVGVYLNQSTYSTDVTSFHNYVND